MANDPVLSSVSVLSGAPLPPVHLTDGESDSDGRRSALDTIQSRLKAAAVDLPGDAPSQSSAKSLSLAEECRRKAAELTRELIKPQSAPESTKKAIKKLVDDPALTEYHKELDAYEIRRRKKGVSREDQVRSYEITC